VNAVLPASTPASIKQWPEIHLANLASSTVDSCPLVFIRGFLLHDSGQDRALNEPRLASAGAFGY
jgi:hypothetical protein